jgi:hypothetical protein
MDSTFMKLEFELSVTSYYKRFDALFVVLSEVTNWDVLPQKINLNLSQADFELLPKKFFDSNFSFLCSINIVEDCGPATKLIPSLKNQTTLPIVTIDDDVHYQASQITKLLTEHITFPSCIIAGRAHRILLSKEGTPLPYLEWDWEIKEQLGPGTTLFPTGVGMVLYPPNVLHNDVFDLMTFPKEFLWNDDIWFYFQARRKGTLVRAVPNGQPLIYVEGSQDVGLWLNGNQIKNDVMFTKLWEIYGNPLLI